MKPDHPTDWVLILAGGGMIATVLSIALAAVYDAWKSRR